MRIYLLKQIESGEATDNVRRSIKEGERLKNFYKQTFLNIFEPLLASQGQTKDTIVEGFDAIIQRLGRYLDSNEAERAKLASERAKKKGIQQIQESTAQALGEPITQPTSIQKEVEEGIAKIQQAAVEKTAEASAKSSSVLGSLKGMWNESQALYEADHEKEQQRKREEQKLQAAIEREEFKSQLRREEIQLQRELNQESLRSLIDQARDSINQAVQEGITRIQDSTQSHEDAILGIQRAANQAIKDIKFAKEYYSKSGTTNALTANASTNTLEVPPQPLSYQPPATITADDLLSELPVVPSASPRTPVLDAEELRRRLEKLQEGTPIMDLTKLRGEVERLEPSQSVAFTELPGAPAVPQESPGPRVVGPRRRQMAMRFGAQPMPQAPKPPPPTAPTPSRSFISFTDPKFLFPPPEKLSQINASDILPQTPTPPPPVPPPLPKSSFVFSSQLQPPAPEAQFQSMSLPQSPFSTAFTSLPPQSNIKPSQPSEPYIPSPQGYSLPPTDRSEIEKLLWDKPKEPSGQPQPKNSREEMEERRVRIISDMGYPSIDEIQKITSVDRIYDMREELKHDIRIQTGKLVGLKNKKVKLQKMKLILPHKKILLMLW